MSTARNHRRRRPPPTIHLKIEHACGHLWDWLFDYDTDTEIARRAAAKAADKCFECRLRAGAAR